MKLLHSRFFVAPAIGWWRIAQPFIGHVWSGAWTCHVVQLIAAPITIVVGIFGCQISFRIGFAWIVPCDSPTIGTPVKQDNVVNATPCTAVIVRACALPNDLITKILYPENAIQHDLQVVTRGGIKVEIEAARWFQHAVKFDQPHRHHHQLGCHVVAAKRLHHAAQQHRGIAMPALRQDIVQRGLRAIPQCQVSSKASSWLSLCLPSGARNRTL